MLELNKIYPMDCIRGLKLMDDNSVDCCVTSPPYWNLRDYGVTGQIGRENTLQEYIEKMTEVFREIKRVLKPTGTLWLNLGDSYAVGKGKNNTTTGGKHGPILGSKRNSHNVSDLKLMHLKHKDLCGIPWRIAFSLQDDGWYLRSDIIWHKPNPMPESVQDRPTKAHEYIFLLSKSSRYFYDSDAIKEPCVRPESSTQKDIERVMMRKRRTDPSNPIPNTMDVDKGSHGNFHKSGRRGENSKTFRGGVYVRGNAFNEFRRDFMENKRLTGYNEFGEVTSYNPNSGIVAGDKEIKTRLAEYENTGLSPEQVQAVLDIIRYEGNFGGIEIRNKEQQDAHDELSSYSADDRFFDEEYS